MKINLLVLHATFIARLEKITLNNLRLLVQLIRSNGCCPTKEFVKLVRQKRHSPVLGDSPLFLLPREPQCGQAASLTARQKRCAVEQHDAELHIRKGKSLSACKTHGRAMRSRAESSRSSHATLLSSTAVLYTQKEESGVENQVKDERQQFCVCKADHSI